MKKIFVAIAAILILSGVFYAYKYFNYQYAITAIPDVNDRERQVIEISTGVKAKDIAQQLYEKKLIVSDWAFLWYIDEHKLTGKLMAGKHYLSRDLTIPQVAEVLTSQRYATLDFIVPEGYTIAQIDAKLASPKFNLIHPGDFIAYTKEHLRDFKYDFLQDADSLEGYLFPATYEIIAEKFSIDGLITKMLNAFERELYLPNKKTIFSSSHSLNEIVIMASLLERESKDNPEERQIISGILWKRLKESWYLGVDATLRYALNNWDEEITYDELQDRNLYNTRKHLGLPPTAIGNPGQSAFKAALLPKTSAYYYYLHDGNGQVHYAVDANGHSQNKNNFL